MLALSRAILAGMGAVAGSNRRDAVLSGTTQGHWETRAFSEQSIIN